MEPQKKVKQNWSIRLGLVQSVILLGIITGSMLCAFYLGIVSGEKAGFESAQADNLNSSVKLPIPEQYREEELDSVAPNLYAKLNSVTESIKPREFQPEEELPTLAAIKTAKVVKPEVPALTDEEVPSERQINEGKDNVITILSGKEKRHIPTAEQPNLGSLKNQKEPLVAAPETLDVAEVFSEDQDLEADDSPSVIETLSSEKVDPPPAKARQKFEVEPEKNSVVSGETRSDKRSTEKMAPEKSPSKKVEVKKSETRTKEAPKVVDKKSESSFIKPS